MKLYVLVVIVVNVSLLPLVPSKRYLFRHGLVNYTTIDTHRNYVNTTFRNIEHLDHHLVPRATVLKVRAHIPILFAGSVRNLPHLRNLNFRSCDIKIISSRAFQNLPKLRIVRLNDNKIETIDNGVFNGLPIEELYLQRNRIKTIRSEAFNNMPNLYKIYLNNNSLAYWDRNWFINTPKLTLLYFKRNMIKELPRRAFVNIRTSHKINGEEIVDTSIYLSHNQIRDLHSQQFEGVDALHELWLDRNYINNIDYTFSNFKQLDKLNLQKNDIEEVGDNAFKNLDVMLELNLAGNELVCLPYRVVAKCLTVKIINNNIECSCVNNLRDKLSANGLSTKIKNGESCDGDEEI